MFVRLGTRRSERSAREAKAGKEEVAILKVFCECQQASKAAVAIRTPFHVKKRCKDGEIHKQLQQGRTTGQREATHQRGQRRHRQKQGDGRVRLR